MYFRVIVILKSFITLPQRSEEMTACFRETLRFHGMRGGGQGFVCQTATVSPKLKQGDRTASAAVKNMKCAFYSLSSLFNGDLKIQFGFTCFFFYISSCFIIFSCRYVLIIMLLLLLNGYLIIMPIFNMNYLKKSIDISQPAFK